MDVARRRGEAARHLRAAARRPRGHPRPRRHRRAARRARPVHAAPALPAGEREGVPGRGPLRRRDEHARRGGRDPRPPADAGDARAGRTGDARLRRRDRAGPADGVGDQDRRPASPRARPRGRGGRARAAARPRSTAIEVEAFTPGEYPTATVRVECGSGTYIRSLAADLGAALGGCAHLAGLRRLRVGSFGLAEARIARRHRPRTRAARCSRRWTRCATSSSSTSTTSRPGRSRTG